MRSGKRKFVKKRERDSLEGPNEETKIQRKALRLGRSLTLSKKKGKCLEEGDPKKRWGGIGAEGKVEKDKGGREISLWIHLEKGSLTFILLAWKTSVLRLTL